MSWHAPLTRPPPLGCERVARRIDASRATSVYLRAFEPFYTVLAHTFPALDRCELRDCGRVFRLVIDGESAPGPRHSGVMSVFSHVGLSPRVSRVRVASRAWWR